jgi:hypothetical protein
MTGEFKKGPIYNRNRVTHLPEVPSTEQDPHARIDVIINIFNAGLPLPQSHGKIDGGFYHEIQTATMLVQKGKIVHGNQISRPLTQSEMLSGNKSSTQIISVAMENDNFRKVDIVYLKDNKVYIVEAKNKRNVDHSQLENNLRLATNLRFKYEVPTAVVYALEGQKGGQDQALQDAYEKTKGNNSWSLKGPGYPLRPNVKVANFEVIHIPPCRFAQD